MAQLDPDQYKRIGQPFYYGRDDGLFFDITNVKMVLVINDTIIGEVALTQTSGSALISNGTKLALDAIDRASMTQEPAVVCPVPLTSMRVWDALSSLLPASAANDDMGHVTGTPGTDSPTLQGVDFGGGSTDEKCAFILTLPPEYDPGETITIRLNAGMLTTVSDGTATVDVQCYKFDRAGLAGSDLCATAAQSINSLTLANKDFTITPTGLAPGDQLAVVLAFGGSDTGNLGVMIPVIGAVEVLLDIKG